MKQIWKNIDGYEGIYTVSSEGEVKSISRPMKNHSRNVNFMSKERVMKQIVSQFGYKVIALSNNGKSKIIKVHRLVAAAFIDNPDNLPCINHKNSIKTDNRVENLEWCTHKQNTKHALVNGRFKPSSGANHVNSKPVYQYNKTTGEFVNSFISCVDARNKTGVNSTIGRIKK